MEARHEDGKKRSQASTAGSLACRPLPRAKAGCEHGALRWPCALGRSGRRARKREGDGATPIGRWLVRASSIARIEWRGRAADCRCVHCGAPTAGATPPADRNYNRPVRHPYAASAEKLWREDGLYDLSSCWTTMSGRACRAAAAPSSACAHVRDLRRPRAASRCARASREAAAQLCCAARTIAIRPTPQRKSARSALRAFESTYRGRGVLE